MEFFKKMVGQNHHFLPFTSEGLFSSLLCTLKISYQQQEYFTLPAGNGKQRRQYAIMVMTEGHK